MSGSRIAALGHHQPARVLTNDDLAQLVDTSDAWIRQRTGIVTRRIADTESVTDLASAAAGKALASAGLAPEEIDMVVVATCSARDRCPSIATQVDKAGWASPRPSASTSTTAARASAPRWPPPTTPSGPGPPGTHW